MRGTPPVITRLLGAGVRKTDWDAVTDAQLVEFRQASNRQRSGAPARLITGRRVGEASLEVRELELPGRRLAVRVHGPRRYDEPLPVIVHFHGGGFVTGAAQHGDWLNSRLAVHARARVVSVGYRLAPEHLLPAALDDGIDALTALLDDAARWGIDPSHAAVFGESAGAMIAAHTAIRAREANLPLSAQVLAYPVTDWTATMLDYPAAVDNADNPMLPLPMLRAFRAASLPGGVDGRALSPLFLDEIDGLAPTLIQTADLDPLEDHGRLYAERLHAAGIPVRLTKYPRALHGFLTMPNVMGDARTACQEAGIYLRRHLHPVPDDDEASDE
jgi:acetyl esterase